LETEKNRETSIFLKDNYKPKRLMSQVIKYRNRDKGVSIKLGNPMTESHGFYNDRKKTSKSYLEDELLFGFWKILYQLIVPKIPDS
jgi:hypothetical protein